MQDLDPRSVRIGRSKLAELLEKAAELLIQRRVLAGSRSPTRAEREMDRALASLHDELYSLALTPLRAVFAELELSVKSAGAGRRFGLLTGGEDLRISASTAEAITTPLAGWLAFVVGNLVDAPEIRVLSGKQAQAGLVLRARIQRQELELTVMDDGNGFDPANPGAEVTRAITPLQEAITRLGGMLEIRSRIGEGSGLVIRIPQSHEVIPGFVVELSGRKFVVPTGQLTEVISTRHYKVHSSTGMGRMIQHHGRVLPIVSLRELLCKDSPGKDANGSGAAGLVVEASGHRICFAVDEILGQRPYAIRKAGTRGPFTVLADGEIAPIVDLEDLARSLLSVDSAETHARAA
jgi:two-component system, chemotaxis family, sensor kinase CheA